MATPIKSFSNQICQSLSTRSFVKGYSRADKAINMVFACALLAIAGGIVLVGAPDRAAPAGYCYLGAAALGAIASVAYSRHRYYKEQLPQVTN